MIWDNFCLEATFHQKKKRKKNMKWFFLVVWNLKWKRNENETDKMNERTKKKKKHKIYEFDAKQMISKQKLHRKSDKPHDTPTKRPLLVYKILVH